MGGSICFRVRASSEDGVRDRSSCLHASILLYICAHLGDNSNVWGFVWGVMPVTSLGLASRHLEAEALGSFCACCYRGVVASSADDSFGSARRRPRQSSQRARCLYMASDPLPMSQHI